MSNIDDSGDVFPDVYQLATTDPGVGGPPNDATNGGTLNRPLRHLAQRTAWLKTRIDTLIAGVGTLASTAVAGIVRLSDSVTSSATDRAATANAVKQANDNANTRVPTSRSITGGGLATGGGALDANRTLTVQAASDADATAGTRADVAMTPAATKVAIDTRFGGLGAASLTSTGLVQLSDSLTSTATDRAATPSAIKQANDNADSRVPNARTVTGGGLITGGGGLGANLTLTVTAATDPEAIAGTRTDVAVTPKGLKAAVDDRVSALSSLGVGQTWQNMLGLRLGGVIYTNDTGKPIMIMLKANHSSGGVLVQVSPNESAWVTVGLLSQNEYDFLSFIVPPGHKYRLATAVSSIGIWSELR